MTSETPASPGSARPASRPHVSVVIPAYRTERYLPRAVRSALAQDLSPIGPEATLEVIVVDDASPDGTRAVAEALAREDPRVRVFSNATNLGAGGGRNRGLREARGEWIAPLDADDALAPGRLACLTALAAREGLDMISDLPELWDLSANASAPHQPEADGRLERHDFRSFLAATTPANARLDGLIKPVIHRRLLDSGLWVYPDDRHGEDFLLFYEALRQGVAFAVLHERLYVFSTRIGGVSGKWSEGSVTPVNYRMIETSSRQLMAAAERMPPDALGGITLAEHQDFMHQRIEKARALDRKYGWNSMRKGAWKRHLAWLRQDWRNPFVIVGMALGKAGRSIGGRLRVRSAGRS